MKPFDLTPDPQVLIALTHTPLKPLDALSELIDNALDSLVLAQKMGQTCKSPMVLVDLPSLSELKKNQGCLRIRDNGPGMSPVQTERALKAGFSGNNPYDSLGLFGMGLNIATGKLGATTKILTARKEDTQAVEVVVDLIQIQRNKNYEVTPRLIEKPKEFSNGTIIEISGWWSGGNPNSDFVKKLVTYGRTTILKELGRRYATILRKNEVRILLNGEPCNPFEHCVWGETRFVERKKYGKIYAVEKISQNLGNQKRCTECFALLPPDETNCPQCGSASNRTIQEFVRGWIGVQRYDDPSHFGIDLIRNGRTIRKLEKTAFFEFYDEFGEVTKDYPIDNPFGRIVGEIHLDHVPVDFLKQHFQTSSP